MLRSSKGGALLSVGVVFAVVGAASGQLLATSARQLSEGSLRLETFYQGTQDRTIRFDVGNPGAGTCTAQGGLQFGCATSSRVDAKGSGGMGVVKLTYQPWETLQYYGSVGVGDFTLNVPSATVNNHLTGDNPGIMATFGVKAVIQPDTDYTPAIALDGSISDTHYWFNREEVGPQAGGGPASINETLNLWQYQVALEVSHVFKFSDNWGGPVDKQHPISVRNFALEPYGGVKWVKTQADLHDLQNGGHTGGQIDVVSPFVGARFPLYEHETLFVEASFVEGYQYAGGMEIRFK